MPFTSFVRGGRFARLTFLLLASPLLVWPAGGSTAPLFAQSGTRGGYLPRPPAQPQATTAVVLEIRLPADAVLEIEGARTRPTGEVRRFVSPPLAMGAKYYYTLKATWREKGKEVTRKRVVPVRAGETVVVDFHREESPRKDERSPKRDDGLPRK